MTVATFSDGQAVEHIGAASHWQRNRWILLGTAIVAGVIAVYYAYVGKSDAVALEQLAQLRSAYAQKCDAPSFAAPEAPAFRDIYLHSSTLQSTVAEQLAALQSGRGCDDVARALRAADFPMPAVEAPETDDPSVTLQPPTQ